MKTHTSITLSYSARIAFIGLSYIYIVKIIDTLWHGIFAYPAMSYSIVLLNILAGFAQVFFFIKLSSSLDDGRRLTVLACWLGIIGSLLNVFPKFLALFLLLQRESLFVLLKNGQLIAVLSPWLGAIMLFGCCVLFSQDKEGRWSGKTVAFLSGAAGYFVLVSAFSLLVYNYLSGVRIDWGGGEVGTDLSVFLISSTVAFLCIGYFYMSFSQERNDSVASDRQVLRG